MRGAPTQPTRRERAKGGGYTQSTQSTTSGARYGMGAPGRRDPETTEDYGGRMNRGESRSHDRHGDQRRGRANMPMRTTGKNTYSKD